MYKKSIRTSWKTKFISIIKTKGVNYVEGKKRFYEDHTKHDCNVWKKCSILMLKGVEYIVSTVL
jgi:hypothetical protein